MGEKYYPLDMVGDAEAATVEEWRELTRNWIIPNMLIAIMARRRSSEKRLASSNRLFERWRDSDDADADDWLEFITAIWALSDGHDLEVQKVSLNAGCSYSPILP